MPNHATPVVVYGFILTRSCKTGNYLPKRTLLLLTAFPLRTAGMPKAFSTVSAGFFHGSISSFTAIAEDCGKPARVRLLKKRWLLPSSSFLAGLAGNRGGEVWRGGTAQTADFTKWAHCSLGSPVIVPYCAAACGTVPAP